MSFGGKMKHKTDFKNKKGDPELPENNDIVHLIEEVKKPNKGEEIKNLKSEKSATPDDDDDEIIILKDVIQVSAEENEEFIELTDEVSMNLQEESDNVNSSQKVNTDQEKAGTQYILLPIEAVKAALEKSPEKISGFFHENIHQAAISTEIIDNAVEAVIRKRFADKLDLMIREAIQKVIKEDIDKLQKQILNQHEKKA
jgi:hypothetical protein